MHRTLGVSAVQDKVKWQVQHVGIVRLNWIATNEVQIGLQALRPLSRCRPCAFVSFGCCSVYRLLASLPTPCPHV
jgi:hypothetical protein